MTAIPEVVTFSDWAWTVMIPVFRSRVKKMPTGPRVVEENYGEIQIVEEGKMSYK